MAGKNHRFTDEENDWIRAHYRDYMYDELTQVFNETFGANVPASSMKCHINTGLRLRKSLRVVGLSPEQEQWVRDNYEGNTYLELANRFNERFGTRHRPRTLMTYIIRVIGLNKMEPYPFTPEEDEWILENWGLKTNYAELARRYEEHFGRPINRQTLRNHAIHTLGIPTKNGFRYTCEEDEWLREKTGTMSYSCLTAEFNRTFGTQISVMSLHRHILGEGLYDENRLKRHHFYTPEEDAWILKNGEGMTAAKLCQLFNERFGTHVSEQAFGVRRRELGVRATERGFVLTREQEEWILKNMGHGKMSKRFDEFQELFGTHITYQTLVKHVRKRDLFGKHAAMARLRKDR